MYGMFGCQGYGWPDKSGKYWTAGTSGTAAKADETVAEEAGVEPVTELETVAETDVADVSTEDIDNTSDSLTDQERDALTRWQEAHREVVIADQTVFTAREIKHLTFLRWLNQREHLAFR